MSSWSSCCWEVSTPRCTYASAPFASTNAVSGGPPLTAFIDANGTVAYVHHGVLTSQQQLNQLVKDKLGVTL